MNLRRCGGRIRAMARAGKSLAYALVAFLSFSSTGFAYSSAYCVIIAQDYADRMTTAGGGAISGVTRGGAGVAPFSAIAGNAGEGTDAGIGAIAGQQSNAWSAAFAAGYKDCLSH
jgi:hypothetical protein